VKLAPDISYDTPNPGTGRLGDLRRLVDLQRRHGPLRLQARRQEGNAGPVQHLQLTYHNKAADVTTPHFINPDLVRWELHRVWVVEATLKPGKRHIYAKRTFYLGRGQLDRAGRRPVRRQGQLYRASFAHMSPSYDAKTPNAGNAGASTT
jgi:hypothetical protein